MSSLISLRSSTYIQILATSVLFLALLPTYAEAHRRCVSRFWFSNDVTDPNFGMNDVYEDCHGLSTGQIVGIVLGSIGAFFLLIGLLTCLCCRRRGRKPPNSAVARPAFLSRFGRKRGLPRKTAFQSLETPNANAAAPTEAERPMTTAQV